MVSKVLRREPQIFLDKLKLGFSILFEKYFSNSNYCQGSLFSWSLFNLQSALCALSSSGFSGPLSRVPLHNTKTNSICQHFFSLFLRLFSSSPNCIQQASISARFPTVSIHSVENQPISDRFFAVSNLKTPFENTHFSKSCEKIFVFLQLMISKQCSNIPGRLS